MPYDENEMHRINSHFESVFLLLRVNRLFCSVKFSVYPNGPYHVRLHGSVQTLNVSPAGEGMTENVLKARFWTCANLRFGKIKKVHLETAADPYAVLRTRRIKAPEKTKCRRISFHFLHWGAIMQTVLLSNNSIRQWHAVLALRIRFK